jgi:hypothetical protein
VGGRGFLVALPPGVGEHGVVGACISGRLFAAHQALGFQAPDGAADRGE